MECVQETALKSSFRKELTPQTFLEELSVFNAQNITSTDDFFVDDLLNFSHEEHEHEEEEALLEEQQPQPQQQNENQSHQIHEPSFNDDNHFDSLPTNELSVPVLYLPLTLKKNDFVLFCVFQGCFFKVVKCWILTKVTIFIG